VHIAEGDRLPEIWQVVKRLIADDAVKALREEIRARESGVYPHSMFVIPSFSAFDLAYSSIGFETSAAYTLLHLPAAFLAK